MDKDYKQLGCQDLDPSSECGFQVRAETEDELLTLGALHAKACHHLDELSPEMSEKVKAAIKTVRVTI